MGISDDSQFVISKKTRPELLSKPCAAKVPKELLSNSEDLLNQVDQTDFKNTVQLEFQVDHA